MKKPTDPYCPKCKLVAVPQLQRIKCPECGTKGAYEEYSWHLQCICNEGLMMPDIADKIEPLGKMPLEVILRKAKK